MPATFAHPAAVLPLRRFTPRWLDFTALVIGSMTPDFGYYVRRFDLATLPLIVVAALALYGYGRQSRSVGADWA